MNLNPGALLQGGKYRIVRFIKSGGFGCTYEAVHVLSCCTVAIKEFFVRDFCNRDSVTGNVHVLSVGKQELVDKLCGKFIDEAQMMMKMRYPGIVRVTDVFKENVTAYYVMDYIDGKSLGEIVAENGPLGEEVAVEYIKSVAAALKYVHGRNCLHLDVKPANILLANDGTLHLIDFGVSKQYDEVANENTSTLMGSTPGYAPPEQTGNSLRKFTPAADIYALGATLYKLLTGITPVNASLRSSGEELDPLPPAISASVRHAVEASMQMNKNKRPQSVEEFIELVESEEVRVESGEWKDESEETEIASDATSLSMGTGQNAANGNAAIEENEIEVEVVETPSVAPEPAPRPQPEENQKKSKWLWIIILLAIICGAAGGFMLLGGGSDVKKDCIVKDTARQIKEKADVLQPYSTLKKDTSQEANLYAQNTPIEQSANLPQSEEVIGESITANEAYAKGLSAYNNKNYKEAVEWYLTAAEQGHTDAQYNLGVFYEIGEGVDQSWRESIKWYRKAAEQGHSKAQNTLGDRYYSSASYTEAIKWYRKAAAQGNIDAQFSISACYSNGEGVSKSESEAVKWCRKAAEQGHKVAQYHLGVKYENGRGVSKSISEAIKWYRKAAEQGEINAQYKLKEFQEKNKKLSTKGIINGHEYVDLGLSVKWATCNVGASKPEEYGNYYAWGETSTKSSYTTDNSKTMGETMNDIGGNPTYDVARKQWGSTWRLPTKAEFEELLSNCTWTWTKQNGIKGCKVTSKKNGNSIFLPAAGWRGGTSLYSQGTGGDYWSSTPDEGFSDSAYYLYFGSGNHNTNWSSRFYGRSVRPVSE